MNCKHCGEYMFCMERSRNYACRSFREKENGVIKGHRKVRNEETKILEAWNAGERSIEEIAQITGYPVKKILKYIPADDEEKEDGEEC